MAQLGKLLRLEFLAADLWADFDEHGEIVGRFETIGEHQGDGVALLEHVIQFKGAVGGIDGHQHGADPRRGELQDDPLRHIRGPDGDVFAAPDAQGQQATRGLFDLLAELLVIPAEAQARKDHRVVLAESLDGAIERLRNGEAVDPRNLRRIGHGNCSPGSSLFELFSQGVAHGYGQGYENHKRAPGGQIGADEIV